MSIRARTLTTPKGVEWRLQIIAKTVSFFSSQRVLDQVDGPFIDMDGDISNDSIATYTTQKE